MSCYPLVVDGEQVGFLCGKRMGGPPPPRCRFCDNWSEKQCDGPMPGKKSGTCDAHLCIGHATTMARKQTVNGKPDSVDYCPRCIGRRAHELDADAREP